MIENLSQNCNTTRLCRELNSKRKLMLMLIHENRTTALMMLLDSTQFPQMYFTKQQVEDKHVMYLSVATR